MNNPTVEPIVLDEQLWQTWLERGKVQGQASARKMRMLTGIVFLAVFASGFYRLALR
jgi:hypothetical protein